MTDEQPSEPIQTVIVCPNCRASNAPGTIICTACGVGLERFHKLQQALQEQFEEETAEHQQQLEDKELVAAIGSAVQARGQTRKLLKWLLIVSLALAVVASAVAAFYARQMQLRRQRLAHDYETATICMKQGDYLCARDTLTALLRAEPGYRDAQDQLKEARYYLAWQLADQGAWSAALSELDHLLKETPDDPRILAAQDEIYSRWLEDAREKGHWLTVLKILMRHPAGD